MSDENEISSDIYCGDKIPTMEEFIEKLRERLGFTKEEMMEIIDKLNAIGNHNTFKLSDCIDIADKKLNSFKISDYIDMDDKKLTEYNDVSALKKQIKYCKNPLEKKRLEQELQFAYKRRKHR